MGEFAGGVTIPSIKDGSPFLSDASDGPDNYADGYWY